MDMLLSPTQVELPPKRSRAAPSSPSLAMAADEVSEEFPTDAQWDEARRVHDDTIIEDSALLVPKQDNSAQQGGVSISAGAKEFIRRNLRYFSVAIIMLCPLL